MAETADVFLYHDLAIKELVVYDFSYYSFLSHVHNL